MLASTPLVTSVAKENKPPRPKLTADELKIIKELARQNYNREVTKDSFSAFMASVFNEQKSLKELATRELKIAGEAEVTAKEITPVLIKNVHKMTTVRSGFLSSVLNEQKAVKVKPATQQLRTIRKTVASRTTTRKKITTHPRTTLKYVTPHKLTKQKTTIVTKIEVNRATENMEITTEPFSVFLRHVFENLADKKVTELPLLLDQFKTYVSTLLTSGQLSKLGVQTNSYISRIILILDNISVHDTRLYFDDIRKLLEDRRHNLARDINDLLDYMDDMYDEDEEEAMQAVLYEIYKYPNTKNINKVAQGFVDYVFLKPMLRVAGTIRGNILFKMIAEVVKKRYKSDDNQ